jgi:hypothetical protein
MLTFLIYMIINLIISLFILLKNDEIKKLENIIICKDREINDLKIIIINKNKKIYELEKN